MAGAKKEQEAQVEEALGIDDFSELLNKEFKPKSDRARAQVEAAVETLAHQVLSDEDLIARAPGLKR